MSDGTIFNVPIPTSVTFDAWLDSLRKHEEWFEPTHTELGHFSWEKDGRKLSVRPVGDAVYYIRRHQDELGEHGIFTPAQGVQNWIWEWLVNGTSPPPLFPQAKLLPGS